MATKTLNLALDEQLLLQVDAAVKDDMGSRSEYFRRLAIQDLQKRREWRMLFDSSNAKGKELGFTSEQQVYDLIQAS
jgi:metal-responsive CopG/Arc/MetJ family transcriptional regulator